MRCGATAAPKASEAVRRGAVKVAGIVWLNRPITCDEDDEPKRSAEVGRGAVSVGDTSAVRRAS